MAGINQVYPQEGVVRDRVTGKGTLIRVLPPPDIHQTIQEAQLDKGDPTTVLAASLSREGLRSMLKL